MKKTKWEILAQPKPKRKIKTTEIIPLLLKNRKIKTKAEREEFFNPPQPQKIKLQDLKISQREIKKAVERIIQAIENKEKIVVFGDYDADGICATAILWEALYALKANCLPYIPERFSEGYGLTAQSIKTLLKEDPDLKLIITVDNGIVAFKAAARAEKMGVDLIITDHHQVEGKKPQAKAVVHTVQVSGAAIAWILAQEIGRAIKSKSKKKVLNQGLDLAGLGTIADVLSLTGPNRSFAKYGLEALSQTQRKGLLALFKEAGIKKGSLGAYHVSFILAPRLNATGRLAHALDSLRLLCTKDRQRAEKLARVLGRTNKKRQKIVEEVLAHAYKTAQDKSFDSLVTLADENYHEGVIGLAAARLVEKFWRPAIVFFKGKKYSKASARSIPGFNIVEVVRQLKEYLVAGGGHEMAAGFTVETKKIDEFIKKLNKIAKPLLTEEMLQKKLEIDLALDFRHLNLNLARKLKKFEPLGLGNPAPTFASYGVQVLEMKAVGQEKRHLKLVLRQSGEIFEAIGFSLGDFASDISFGDKIDIVFRLEEDVWNGERKLQLKIKDIQKSD